MREPEVNRMLFATKPEFVRRGFDRAIAGLDLEPGHKEDLYETWLPAHRSGDPRQELDALFLHLGGFGWRWRALDDAATLFEGGTWPRPWQGWIDRPYKWDGINPAMRLKLLVGHLGHCAYLARDLANFTEPSTAQVFRITLATSYPDCPVEAGFIALNGPAIERGDYSALPPYYPGSTIYLKAVSRRRSAQLG